MWKKKVCNSKAITSQVSGKHVMLKYMNYSAHIHTKGYYIFQKGLTGYFITCYNKYTAFEAWAEAQRSYIKNVH